MIQSTVRDNTGIDPGRQMEALLIELSTRFINLPWTEIDREIEAALTRIGELLGLDRCTFWMSTPDAPERVILTHRYQRPEVPPSPYYLEARSYFPWTLDQLARHRTIAIENMDDLPPEAAQDRESWQRYATCSSLIVPLSTGGVGLGAITFATVRAPRPWPDFLVKRLELFAQVFSNALARARNEQALRESRERYALAMEGAHDGLWDWNLVTGRVQYSQRWKNMLGYADGDVAPDLGAWEALLHHDDRARAKATLEAHLSGESPVFELEHRLRAKDGTYRWILARGKVLRDADGRPQRMAGSHTDITARKQAEARLQQAFEEVKRLSDRLDQENIYLRKEVEGLYGVGRIVGQSAVLRKVFMQAAQVAPLDSTVLLRGETGTGKELIAAAIHDMSPRREQTMVRVNCAAIPGSLLESELFGREKGAYTGALSKQVGRFEMANGSTLFLDEIGELPPEIQVKLLRFLQEKQVERLGSSRTLQLDVRVITATNRDLEKAVRDGRFREDLYYRLNVFPITVPPLRERREDIPKLVSAFVNEFAMRFGKNIEAIDKKTMEALQRYHWPGNVRELRNAVERAMIMASGPTLYIEPPEPPGEQPSACLSLREIEIRHILQVLNMTNWRIRGSNGAAEVLGLKPSTLESRMAKLGIRRPTAPPK